MIRALPAGGVVDHNAEVSGGCRPETGFDILPGSQKVAQADHTEIRADGGAQQGRPAEGSGHAGNHPDRAVRKVFPDLQHQGRHPVDPRVAAAQHDHTVSFPCFLKGHNAAFPFLPHRGREHPLPAETLPEKSQIDRVADDHIGRLQHLNRFRRHTFFPAGSHADHRDLSCRGRFFFVLSLPGRGRNLLLRLRPPAVAGGKGRIIEL